MSHAQPVGAFPPPPASAAPRTAALPGLAVLMIVDLLLELAVLAHDLAEEGAAYLPTALGFSYQHNTAAPINFYGGDTVTCVTLAVLIVAAFGGRGWVRTGGSVLLLTNAYGVLSGLVLQLTGTAEARSAFAAPVVPNLLLNLDELAQLALGLVFALVVLATRQSAPRTAVFGARPVPPAGSPVAPPAPVPGAHDPARS
ncbi:hypothetical protein ACIGXM_17125 [Kitasatospora sp. NPDC052896]|uniref:hypothetical protein n=1 Tax=Kitasatospora sp. NPDC052896 TaxID=3364061 RepID=UPI0037C92D58